MLEDLNLRGGDLTPERFKGLFAEQISSLGILLKLNEIPYCEIGYHDTIKDPVSSVKKICDFLQADLSPEEMVAVVDPALYRQKKK